MLTDNKPGLEVLMAGNNNDLGKITEAWIVEARQCIKKGDIEGYSTVTKTYLNTLKNKTGLDVEFYYFNTDMRASAFINTKCGWKGHAGTKYTSGESITRDVMEEVYTTDIDLAKGKVSGKMSDSLRFQIGFASGLFTDLLGFTPAETAAVFMHEVGHAFESFASVGEYVYLNYYLTEGIDILQGKKVNKYKIELLDDKWIVDNISPELRDAFINERDESTTRKAILSAYKKTTRGHLGNNGLTSKRRDEQAADLFVTRLGYARPLATGLTKIEKYSSGSSTTIGSSWMAETIRVMFMIAFAPVTAYAIIMENPLNDSVTSTRYDNGLERIMKIRRDLIQQLKILGNKIDNKHIVDDIDAIDKLAKAYSSNRTMFDEAVTFFRPTIRKMEQNAKNEENLEELLNNDLFVNIFKLQNL